MKPTTEAQRHEDQRKRLWTEIAVAVARCDVNMGKDVPARFADAALDGFDKRFAKPEEPTTFRKE